MYKNKYKNYPKTQVITAEFDPLRDYGRDLYENMKRDNVTVRYKEYKGSIHGFTIIPFDDNYYTSFYETLKIIKNDLNVK